MTDTDKHNKLVSDLWDIVGDIEDDKIGRIEYLLLTLEEYPEAQKPITPEEREASLKVCRSIGKNVTHRAWQKKEGA